MISKKEFEECFDNIRCCIRNKIETYLTKEIAEELAGLILKDIQKRLSEYYRIQYNCHELLDAFCERRGINRNQMLNSQCFESQFFGGNGDKDPKRDGTGQSIAILYYKLDQAISTVGGSQQNGGMGTEFDAESDQEGKKLLDLIVRDIAMALTGKRIKFVETAKV